MKGPGKNFGGESGKGEIIDLTEKRARKSAGVLPDPTREILPAQNQTESTSPKASHRELRTSPTTPEEVEALHVAVPIVGRVVEETGDAAEAIQMLSEYEADTLEALSRAIAGLTEARLANHLPAAKKFRWTNLIRMAIEKKLRNQDEI